MDNSSRICRAIFCLPFFFGIADHANATPIFLATDEAGAQRVTLAKSAFERCRETELVVGRQPYRVACDRTIASPGVRHWEGHLAGSPDRKVSFQIRPDGVTGLLDLPERPLRLGLVDGVQWLLDTPAAQLHAELAEIPPPLFVVRDTEAGSAKSAQRNSPSSDPPSKPMPNVGGKPAEVAYPVMLNLADLASVEPGGQVDLGLPGLQQNVTYEKTVVSPTGSSTWIGYLTQYGRDYPVVLTYGVDGSASGSIQGPGGEWLVTGAPGQIWLVDTAGSGLRHNPLAKDEDAIAPPSAATQAQELTAEAAAQNGWAAGTSAEASVQDGNTIIDVLVLYTPGLVARHGGEAGAANRIDYLVSLANQAYANSGVGITLRRVGLQRVELGDNTSNSTTLSQLRTGAGAFAAIPALRNSTGADGVLLVRPFDMAGQGGSCGVGYVAGYGGTPMSAYSEYAFAVISDGRDTGGTSYYCTDTSFAHELGHNMGLMHDRETVARQGGGSGALPYAFGYGKPSQFGTIMSYIYPVVARFSNPRDTSCSNGPCGVSSEDTANSADNARALGVTRAPFSAYRATTTASTVSVAGIVTIDGKVAANVKVLANGTQCALTGSTGAYACQFASGWSGTIAASAIDVTFAPPSASYTDLRQSTSRNFAGTISTVAINGTATVDGKAAAGVTVSAGNNICGTTEATGRFTCRVTRGWSGAIGGTSATATFRSVNLTAVTSTRTIVLTGVSKRIPVTIKGAVRINGLAAAGVTISASGATCSRTDSAGAYTCSLYTRTSGAIRASLPGTTFAPASRTYTNILDSITQDFDGKRPQVSNGVKATVPSQVTSGTTGTRSCTTAAPGNSACPKVIGW